MLRNRTFIAVGISVLLYAETYVASIGHWWPDFRQVLFISSTLLTISLASVWFAESGKRDRWQRILSLAILIAATYGIGSRSMGPELFAANWFMICGTLTTATILLRWNRDSSSSTSEQTVGSPSTDSSWNKRLPHLFGLYLCVSIFVRLIPNDFERPATIHWCFATAITSCVFAEIASYARLRLPQFGVLAFTGLIGGLSFWRVGERITRAYLAGSTPVEYAERYTYTYAAFAIALLVLHLLRRSGSPRTNPENSIEKPMPSTEP